MFEERQVKFNFQNKAKFEKKLETFNFLVESVLELEAGKSRTSFSYTYINCKILKYGTFDLQYFANI